MVSKVKMRSEKTSEKEIKKLTVPVNMVLITYEVLLMHQLL